LEAIDFAVYFTTEQISFSTAQTGQTKVEDAESAEVGEITPEESGESLKIYRYSYLPDSGASRRMGFQRIQGQSAIHFQSVKDQT
jgi:hypothetical protein